MDGPKPIADLGVAPTRAVTESELAELAVAEGALVREHRGHYWRCQRTRGFWHPVARMLRLAEGELGPPSRIGSGHRSFVADPSLANTTIPMMMLPDLHGYDAGRLTPTRRSEVRGALRRNEFRQLTDTELLAEQGWEVSCQFRERTGQPTARDRASYLAMASAQMARGFGVIAGLRDGRLGGYISYHHTAQTGYLHSVVLSDAGLSWDIGSGLYWLVLRSLAQVPRLEEVFAGLWWPSAPTIAAYKSTFGVRAVSLPAHAHLAPGLAPLLRRDPVFYANIGGPGAVGPQWSPGSPTRA